MKEESLININKFVNHLKNDFGLEVTNVKEKKSINAYDARLLSSNCKMYISNTDFAPMLVSRNFILNENGNFIINKKITNEKMKFILNNLLYVIKIIECFNFKQELKDVYPNIHISINFDFNLKIKGYKISFIHTERKQVFVFTKNKRVLFNGYNIINFRLDENFIESNSSTPTETNRYLKFLKDEWPEFILLDNGKFNFEYIKNLNNILKI